MQYQIQARDYLAAIYLDWLNNYVSVEKFAEHNGLSVAQAMPLINLARDVFDSKHPDE